ncbi:hypothetical protein AB0J77_14695 [Micromonospora tulbaghiae]|uniref:hypothetical protein n=1 Tax=Micromonospora tulbaghiae TaxID=479978 RepID=UPI00344400D6
MRVTVNSTGLNELAAVLDAAAEDVVDEGRKVVARGAMNIKKDARRFASGIAHAPSYPYSIGYDTKVSGATVSAEIGPDKAKRQGALGNILEYGTVNNAPYAHLGPALDIEGPRFVAAVEKLGADLLEDQ